jgi:AraC family cel operon transcriptional repressor
MEAAKSIKLYSEELIDPGIEFHYAFHKSLAGITAIHTHNFFELFLVVNGEVLHTVNGKTHLLTGGTLVFMRAHDVHAYRQSGENEFQLINLAFRESTLRSLFTYLGDGFPSDHLLKRAMPARVVLPEGEKSVLAGKLQQLNTIPRDQKERIRSTLRILLFEIFTRYFAVQPADEKRLMPPWLETLLHEIQKKENFVQGIRSVYALSHRSPEHISRAFRKYLRTTPTDYLNDLRLHYAANLLSNSDDSVTFVALEAGFENISHFYHLFSKKFLMSPARFRTNTQKSAIPSYHREGHPGRALR